MPKAIDLLETSSESDGLPASNSPAMLGACKRFRRSGMKPNQDWPLMDSISSTESLAQMRRDFSSRFKTLLDGAKAGTGLW